MISPTQSIKGKQNRSVEDKNLFPQLKLLNLCNDLSHLISDNFLNKSQSLDNHLIKKIPEIKEKFNINTEKIYKELLNDNNFLNDLKKLFTSLISIINKIDSFSKKMIEEQKIKILFDLNKQLNNYLNNIPKEKDKKLSYLISSNSKKNDIQIIEQINKFISLNEEEEEQDSKETIIVNKDNNNFDNLSEIGQKESEKESILEEEKKIIENLKGHEKEKRINIFGDCNINRDSSFLNHKIKRKKNIIDSNEK